MNNRLNEMRVSRCLGVLVGVWTSALACSAYGAGVGEEHLLLNVSFDKGLASDRGEFKTSSAHPLSFEEGLSGKAVMTGVVDGQGYSGVYSAAAAVPMPEGTVNFWVRPFDWDGRDKRFKVFFEARGSGSQLTIYKYFDVGMDSAYSGKLLFRFASLNQGANTWSDSLIATDGIRNWRLWEWHQVSCSWNGRSINLHVDGKLAVTRAVEVPAATTFREFAVGGFNPEGWGATAAEGLRPGGRTLIDELRVYGTALSARDIQEECENKRPVTRVTPDSHLISVPRATGAPILDGRITEGEYPCSATGFFDICEGIYAGRQSRYHLSWDDESIYIAVVSPARDGLRAEARDRDHSRIVRDDAVEILLNSDIAANDYFQLVFNSTGAFYDGRNGDRSWSVKSIPVNNRVTADEWVIELAIPFDELGVASPRPGNLWRFNLCRTFTAPTVSYTSLSPARDTYYNPRTFVYLRFLDPSPGVHLSKLGDLTEGKLDMEMMLLNPDLLQDKLKVQVQLQAGGKKAIEYEKEYPPSKRVRIPLDADGFPNRGELDIKVFSAQQGLRYAAVFPFAPRDQKPFRLQYLYTDIGKKALHLGLSQPYILYLRKEIIGRVRLHNPGREVVREKSFPGNAYNYEVSLDISGLTPADYTIDLTFLDAHEQKLASLTEGYRIFPDGKPPWEANRIGWSDTVPAPWTPLKVVGDTVRCWGREYRFDGSLFPSGIISQGHSLLEAPIRLQGVENGREVSGQRSILKWKEKKDDRVRLVTGGRIGSIGISVETLIEYDGFMWMKLSLNANRPTRLDKLVLEIPFAGPRAVLRNLGDYRLERTGLLPQETFYKNLVQDKPIFWLGNQDAGLQWFAEDLKGWHVGNYDRALEVVPGKDVVVARLNIIDKPLTMEGRREIRFGFQATPVKERPQGWRRWKVQPDMHARSQKAFNLVTWFTYWGELAYYPDVATIAPKARQIEDYRAKGIKVAVYLSLGATTRYSPEYKYYGELWRQTPCYWNRMLSEDPIYAPLDRHWHFYVVCPNSGSYRDSYLWKLAQVIKKLNLEGLYLDQGVPYRCDNPLHGCGWRDDAGQSHLTYNILGTRELARRIYVAMKKHHRESVVIHHMSGEVTMPVHAFADILVDGENLTGLLAREESYYNILPFDKFQAEYMSRSWGPVVLLLPEFIEAAYKLRPERVPFWSTVEAGKPLNHLIGLSLVHDGFLWPMSGINLDAVWEVQDSFGWDNQVEFLPYWSNEQYVRISSLPAPGVVVSAFRRLGKYLFVPFNNTDRDIDLQMQISRAACGFPEGRDLGAVDRISGESFRVIGNRLSLPLQPRAFRMIEVKP